MLHRMVNKALLCLLAAASVTACTVGPDYHTPDMQMPEKYAVGTTSAAETEQWWEGLHDKELNALIDRAIKNNLDLAISLDRLQEARVQESVVMGSSLPTAGASASIARGTGSDLISGRVSPPLVASETDAGLKQIGGIAGFDAEWELDLFGKYRREYQAATYNVQAVRAARNDTLLSIVADVARSYVDMRALQMRLAVLQKNMQNLQDNVNLTRERFNRGITNGLDVALAQRELAELKAQQAPLEAQVKAAQYAIAVLLGQFPQDLSQELDRPALIPHLPDKIDAGIPLDLLRRRPDIQQADREAAQATAKVGVATADLFPHVSLSAAVGADGQSDISRHVWSIGPSIGWSLLDFGTLDGLVEVADYRAKELLAVYKRTVLDAVREVDTALNNYSAQQNKLSNLNTAMEASQTAVSIATKRYNRGLTDSLNVIDAERQEYALEDEYVQAQQQAAEQYITLYKALGGGWQKYDRLLPVRAPRPAIVAAFSSLAADNDLKK